MKKFVLIAAMVLSCNSKKEAAAVSEDSSSQMPVKMTEISFTAPDSWIAEPPSSQLRKAQFKIPGKGDEGEAEMTVFYFPGAGGSVEANLDRWYGQFKQPDGSSSKDKASKETRDINGLKVTVVSVTGVYQKPVNPTMMGGPVTDVAGYGLKAAIVETEGGPWFFKMVGPEGTLDGASADFDQFVNTFSLK